MPSPVPELDEVTSTLKFYMEGTESGDVSLLRRAFHPKATMSGYIFTPAAPPGGMLFFDSINVLFSLTDAAHAPKAAGSPYQARIGSIAIQGNMASAIVYESQLMGRDYVNNLQLHKLDGRWTITAKAFDSTPAG